MKKLLLLLVVAFGITSATYAQETEYTEVATSSEFIKAFDELRTAVKVMADINVETTSIILVDTETILDLNGHTLNLNHGLAHRGYTSFTITDGSEAQTGAIVGTATVLHCYTPGPVYIKGGTFSVTDDSYQPVISVGKDGHLTLEAGRINASNHGEAVENDGDFKIMGGTIVGCNMSLPPVFNNGIGVTTFTAGAVYAGNRCTASCFENAYWTDGVEVEEGKTILPEGAYDGGAIVTDSKWAIPGTHYINYHLPEGAEMQPATHYYYPGTAFALPECNYYNGYPFAGWATNAEKTGDLLTEISAKTAADFQLYPVWKYTTISDNVTPDLTPGSVSPEPGSRVESISSIVLSFGEMDLYAYEGEREFGYITNTFTGEKVATLSAPTTDWDGNVTFTVSPEITDNGIYRVFIAAGAFGNDDWYYDDYEGGRCNPDLFYDYTIRKAPEGTNNVTATPADKSSVAELSTISLTFRDGEGVTYDYDMECTLTDAGGNTVATLTWMDMNYDYLEEDGNEYEQVIITLPEAVTAAGTYTLNIPAEFFSYDYGQTPVSALTFTWTISVDGIKGVETNGAALCIYDLSGRRIQAASLKELPAGIYIVNGRKVAVK